MHYSIHPTVWKIGVEQVKGAFLDKGQVTSLSELGWSYDNLKGRHSGENSDISCVLS